MRKRKNSESSSDSALWCFITEPRKLCGKPSFLRCYGVRFWKCHIRNFNKKGVRNLEIGSSIPHEDSLTLFFLLHCLTLVTRRKKALNQYYTPKMTVFDHQVSTSKTQLVPRSGFYEALWANFGQFISNLGLMKARSHSNLPLYRLRIVNDVHAFFWWLHLPDNCYTFKHAALKMPTS